MPLLRLAEFLIYLLFVGWTVVFPLATLLSLLVILPLTALVMPRQDRRLAAAVRA